MLTADPTSRTKKPMTLRRIAGDLEVDIGTVSRALANEPGVSKELAERIRAYASAVGYRPKPMRRGRADAIGLVVRSVKAGGPTVGYLERMVYQAEVGATSIGKHLHVHMLRPGAEGGDWPKFISESRVDGVLILGQGTQDFYQRLRHEPIPSVALNDTVDATGVDCVMCDPRRGIEETIHRLLSLGHRSIGLAITHRDFATVARRYESYMAVMRQAGIEPDSRWVVQDIPEGLRGGQQAVRTFIASGVIPSAIIFNDDWVAMGGVYELARQGLRVPEHVSVVGYDNTAISEELTPSLCSIDNREQQIMATALQMLQERMNGVNVPPRQEILPSYLVWRESCTRVRDADA